MNLNELKQKYGDTEVMVVPATAVEDFPRNCFIKLTGDYATDGMTRNVVDGVLLQQKAMYRYEAEIDPRYKQIIPYVIIHRDGKIFCTKRLKGDERLVGQVSVGTGGHLERGEYVVQGMYRELQEEVGLDRMDGNPYRLEGLLLDESTEVSSVHLGLVFSMQLTSGDIAVKEVDKLEGAWMTPEEIESSPNIESWSKLVLPLIKELCA